MKFLNFGGGGASREIAQAGSEILPKVSPKLCTILGTFCEFKISPKPHH